jgi:hypothetical protein
MSVFKNLVDDVFGKKDPKSPPLVEVQWVDATDIGANWFDMGEIERCIPAPSLAVGYLFSKDKDSVKVVPLVNHDHGGNGILIPMGMVKKITYLHRQK